MNLTIKLKLFLAFFAIMFFIFIFCDGFIIEALFSTIIGGGFVYAGFYMRKYIQNMKEYGIRTQAKIIDFHVKEVRKTRMGSDDITEKVQYYYPIVSFVDLNGIQVTQKADSSVNFKEINDLIDIIYLKKNDNYEVIIDSNWRKSYFAIIFIIIGLYFFLSGLLRTIGLFYR